MSNSEYTLFFCENQPEIPLNIQKLNIIDFIWEYNYKISFNFKCKKCTTKYGAFEFDAKIK